jgi:hypothetical protein
VHGFAIALNTVIASEAKQSIGTTKASVDCFVARAPRNDGKTHFRDLAECFFREVFIYFPPSKQRAQGMPGARDLLICPSGQITCARTKDPGGCNADGSACGLSIFLDETAYPFLEAIKLCSVRHNRESNETIHSNEYPQTKTNLSSRPKLGRGT